STEDHLVFDVEVINESDKEILVSPEAFYYRCKNQYGTSLGQHGYAINPEEKLLQIDKQISAQNAREANQAVLSVLTTTADAANMIASLDEDRETRNRAMENAAVNQFHREDMRRKTHSRAVSLREKREYWSFNVLRKTTLNPGFYIGGKVYFPRNDRAGTFTFILPINNETYVFSYQQKLK
ncbi:MAG TPA: hypothetical protein VJ939_01340, partial [Bacteroidales bacterium]|nr:hypothetical protein [Bacteroidales bacterium]